jgi:hypothetical protein
MINREKALKIFTNKIKNNESFVFAKFGDGELACMSGETGYNCDHHPYTPELGKLLVDSFVYLNQNFDYDNYLIKFPMPYCGEVFIADWQDDGYKFVRDKIIKDNSLDESKMNLVYYDTMLHVDGQLDNNIKNFILELRNTKRRKIFVGPERLSGVNKMLNIDAHFIVHPNNSWASYSLFLEQMHDLIQNPDDIVIFSAGLTSKAWIYSLLVQKCSTLTCIDMGSSFDPIFVGRTRLKQLPMQQLKEFYKEIL